MSEANKAVFLSYASQDAEAAKRICDALRAAGIEVWFDVEGGLETGDEWDAKIRRQIKECVLFLPVISANTQAREEGYFRIEWDLAAERARGIASGVPFILPLVIDDTREPEALVPDRFRSVQWTRAADGELSAEQRAKFGKLWSHRAGLAKHAARADVAAATEARTGPSTGAAPAASRRRLTVGAVALALALVAFVGWQLLRPTPSAESDAVGVANARTPAAPGASVPAPGASGARDWPKAPELKPAVALLDGLQAIPEDFRLAEEIAQRELDKNPTDPERVTVMARVHSMWLLRGWDRSTARYQKAKSIAERALQLAPDEPEALIALAIHLYARGAEMPRALDLAQRAVDLRPDEPRFHRMRDNCLWVMGLPAGSVFLDNNGEVLTEGLARALESAKRTAERFPKDALARYELVRHYRDIGRWADFERTNDETLALAPVANAMVWKARARFAFHGDLAGMKAILDQVPARVRGIERTVFGYFLYSAFSGRSSEGLEALNGLTEPWMIDFDFRGPKALPAAALLELDGKRQLARVQYDLALAELLRYRARSPEDAQSFTNEAWIRHGLGQTDEARAALRISNESQLRPYAVGPFSTWWFQSIPANLLLGDRPTALAFIREACASRSDGRETIRQRLALDPRLAGFRNDPEIVALLAEPAKAAARAPSDRTEKSVAVLAFANLSDDKANEYFSDGITEELLNVLAKVPGLKVTARTSSFFFKGKEVPVPEIAKQLGVAYVVEGSVRKVADKVRITAKLIKAADGLGVWSDTFTRDLQDVFAVQDEIAGLIARSLSLKLEAAGGGTLNPEAYRLYLEGREAWNRRTAAGLRQAEILLSRAVELEPRFARAHAALADVWKVSTDGLGNFRERQAPRLVRTIAKAEQAVALDPSSAEAHAALGSALCQGWRLAEGRIALHRAIELNPNYASAHQWLGRHLMTVGQWETGLAALRRATELDPLSHRILDNYADALEAVGRLPEALAMLERAAALHPAGVQIRCKRALLLSGLGRRTEAVAAARALAAERDGEEPNYRYSTAVGVLMAAGEKAEAETWLRRIAPESEDMPLALAFAGRVEEFERHMDAISIGSVHYYWCLPQFAAIRAAPEFRNWIRKAGLGEALAPVDAWWAAQKEKAATKP